MTKICSSFTLAIIACTATASPPPSPLELVRLVASSKTAARYIDPKLGVLDWAPTPKQADQPTQVCGDAAAAKVERYFQNMVEREKTVDAISCSPQKLASGEAVTCTSDGPAEYAPVFHVTWIADAERGWRIAALVTTEQGERDTGVWTRLGKAIATGARCK